ncbi:prepilin-type N-terminal cleavage/methylation domain-containing protein [uncultured Clostridium sp.]|nr:prepilin-type N-terminal cleavage/methylation domain-containing protein [uncultured Clostridium sp.]
MKKRVKGMTLIEMIISLSILTIIVGVIYIFFFSSNRILSDADINE